MRFKLKSIFLMLLLPIIITFSQTDSLIISEVMFYPSASNSEFIELFNFSHLNSIDLSKFQIIYYTSKADTLVGTNSGLILPPRSFAVVFEGDYDLTTGTYSLMVPSNALILKIDNNNFGLSGMANTSDRTINLVSALGDTVDAYTYSADNAKGISDEKIILNKDQLSTNWANSLTVNGTPGKENSVSQKEYDLSIANFYPENNFVFVGNPVKLNAVVKNLGSMPSGNYSLKIYHDLNADSIAQENEFVYRFDETGIAPEDSAELYVELSDYSIGTNYYIAELVYDNDANIENNFAYLSFIGVEINEIRNDIVINEIMYAPNNPEPEWIELYNRSDKIINIKNYQIADKADTVKVIDDDLILQPSQYFVIAKDSSFTNIYSDILNFTISGFPTLNNTGDRVMILDSLNRVIDSLEYTRDWGGNNGVSLERIDSDLSSIDSSNWSSAKLDSGGTPGMINSVAQRKYDLAINQFYPENDHIIKGEPVKIYSVIKNIGKDFSGNFSLKIFHDTNADSIAQENELIHQFDESGLAPSDSIELYVELLDYSVGTNYYLAELVYDEDLNNDNNFSYLSFIVVETNEIRNDIVINEIMYAPNSPEPEWIEVYNRSSKTINLKNYQIADNSDTVKVIYDSLLFQPHHYFVIAKDSSFINIYSDTLNFIISRFPNLNNTGDRLMILDSLNRVIDSLEFNPDWGGKNGVSLERIDSELPSIDSTNWSSAKLDSGGTPGVINSVTPREYDLTIEQFYTGNDYAIIGESVKLYTVVKNIGKKTSTPYSLKLFYDYNADSIAQENELVYQFDEAPLVPNDSTILYAELTDFNVGENYYIAELIYNDDLNNDNNSAFLNFIGVAINEIRNDIVINEIMYAPNSPEPEWIELYNRSSKTINLRNYQIADEVDTAKVINNDIIFQPKQYFVVAKDSSFITVYNDTLSFIISDFSNLNNSGDRLMILDSLNRTIDSLKYTSDWGGKNGISLERIDSELPSIDSTNWSSAKLDSGGTPGAINTITKRDYDAAITGIIFNPNFPLYGEMVNISAAVKNTGKNNLSFSLKLFEDVHLDTASFQLLETSSLFVLNKGDSINVDFNYAIDSIKEAHAFLVEVVSGEDQDTSNNKLYAEISLGYPPKTMVINEIMYSPINGEPEWIEFYNTGNKVVNLKNWVISDIYTTPKVTEITTNDFFVQGNEYFVIAKDSTIWEYHRTIPSPILIDKFANLNNDIDGVVLKDQYGNPIDSIEYKNSWGGVSGHSLERRFCDIESNDTTNWGSSVDIELSTPGRKNSITPKSFDLKITDVATNPEFPTINEDVYVTTVVHNIGVNEVSSFSVIIELSKSNSISELERFSNLNLKSGDSLTLTTKNTFVLDDSAKIICKAISTLDNDTTNNTLSIMLYPSFLKNSIILNEFMANPNTDKAEWIELYNNSGTPISIKNWSISDLLTTPKKKRITEDNIFIQQGEYFIVTSDTSKFPGIDNVKIFEVKFGTLGNYDDGILLYDFNDKIIDSLRYDKDWGIEKGRSLERVSFDAPTTDIDNWLPSLSVTCSTPGASNSIIETKPFTKGDIKINEIMFDPDNDNSEFIELYNNTDFPVDIGGWSMVDASDNYFELSETFFQLSPNEYFIFAADSSIFNSYPDLKNSSSIIISNTGDLSLFNDEETIMIFDHWGNVIDSIHYKSEWHNRNINITKNKSLERINPSLDGNDKTNWSTCVDPIGATPAKQNSIFTEEETSGAKLSFSPNPFSPDNDGYEDFTLISYNLSVSTAQIRIKIFDDKGRLVRTLVNNKPSGKSGTEIFDGLDDNGNPLRIGMYIVFVEASNSTNGVVDILKDVIVIARKL